MCTSHEFERRNLIRLLSYAVGRTLGEIDTNDIFAAVENRPRVTGVAGDVIEQSLLGYPADNAQRPDLDVDGVLMELKTTGIRKRRVGRRDVYVAKEPASITAVSIGTIEDEEFDDSAFWHKIAHMLFVFYEYESPNAVPPYEYRNFHVRGYNFFEFTGDDLDIIKNDWQIIHDFLADIRERCSPEEARREYPNLSTLINRQTVYLDTAPKYPHPPRFRIRKRVVDQIINEVFDGTRFRHIEHPLYELPEQYIGYADLVERCHELTLQYRNKTVSQLAEELGITTTLTDKNIAEKVIVAMFGGEERKLSKIGMFVRFGIKGKSITLSNSESRTEDTKLVAVNFEDLQELEVTDEETGELRAKRFEDSELYSFLNDHKFLFTVFQEPSTEAPLADNVFLGFKLLDLAYDELLEDAKACWEKARWLLLNNELRLEPCKDRFGNQRYTPKTHLPMNAPNFPKASEYDVFIRGTGNDAAHKKTINGLEMYHQDYWVKGSILVERLNTIDIID